MGWTTIWSRNNNSTETTGDDGTGDGAIFPAGQRKSISSKYGVICKECYQASADQVDLSWKTWLALTAFSGYCAGFLTPSTSGWLTLPIMWWATWKTYKGYNGRIVHIADGYEQRCFHCDQQYTNKGTCECEGCPESKTQSRK